MKCAIITPVGPGHMGTYENECLPSINDAISHSRGPFQEIIPIMMDDTEGKHGRSSRRNDAINIAKERGCDWLFFLDADDFMSPDAFEMFEKAYADYPEADCVWGLIAQSDGRQKALRPGQPEKIESFERLLGTQPFLSIQIGFFGKTECVSQFGFDEDMDTGEDFKLYFQLWESFDCVKVPYVFFLNRQGLHSTGPRSATGVDWSNTVIPMWAKRCQAHNAVAEVREEGRVSYISISNPEDPEQFFLCGGEYYRFPDLKTIRKNINKHIGNPRILDIGPGLGAHMVFCFQNMAPSRIFPVGASQEETELLRQTVSLNEMNTCVDFTALESDPGQGVDHILPDQDFDYVRIDIPGDEMDILNGAKSLIDRCRPLIWVEVSKENMNSFIQTWCKSNSYKMLGMKSHLNSNGYMIGPKNN